MTWKNMELESPQRWGAKGAVIGLTCLKRVLHDRTGDKKAPWLEVKRQLMVAWKSTHGDFEALLKHLQIVCQSSTLILPHPARDPVVEGGREDITVCVARRAGLLTQPGTSMHASLTNVSKQQQQGCPHIYTPSTDRSSGP